MDRQQAAEQMRRTLQIYANTLPEKQALEVAAMYPKWEAGRAYAVGDILQHGVNSVGDPQLYRVVQAHNSQADWLPEATPEPVVTPLAAWAAGISASVMAAARARESNRFMMDATSFF